MKKQKRHSSVSQAADRLGISRATLNKEIEEGGIVAHRRRGRIIFFVEDLEEYERRNVINNGENISRIGACNNLNWKSPVSQVAQSAQN